MKPERVISELLRWSVVASFVLLTAGMAFAEPLIMPGLLLLICTPILRVAASVTTFIWTREWGFVWITSAVLALTLLSFALGRP